MRPRNIARREEPSPWRVVGLGFFVVATLLLGVARFQTASKEVKESSVFFSLTPNTEEKKKNIVIFLIDDQGHNDFGTNSTDLSWTTPRLSELAANGIRINRHYAMHLCTPARAALLTGRLPIHTGMQSSMISGNAPWGLPLHFEIMPNILKKDGYGCHAIGKWHLGHFHQDFLPQSRGFDSFFGSYSGFQDHFSHVSEVSFCAFDGAGCWFDLHSTSQPVTNHQDEFAIFILGQAANKIIQNHNNKDIPLFLYFAAPTVHMPIEPPGDALNLSTNLRLKLEAIPNARRRAFAAETLAMDYVAGSLIDNLQNQHLWHDTIFCALSDNGAQPQVVGSGNNYPLRGMKGFYFDGGIRTPAFIFTPFLSSIMDTTTLEKQYSYDGLFSIVDWLPTLYQAATGKTNFTQDIDGVSHWDALLKVASNSNTSKEKQSIRTNLILNIDEFSCDINATAPECLAGNLSYPTGSIIVNNTIKLIRNAIWLPIWNVPFTNDLQNVSADAQEETWADAHVQDFVFDLKNDPTESQNLVQLQPELYQELLRVFNDARLHTVPSVYCPYSDDDTAASIFNKTHFIGPWRSNASLANCLLSQTENDDIIEEDGSIVRPRNEPNVVPVVQDELSLPGPRASTSVEFPAYVYCRYGLLPPSSSLCRSLSSNSLSLKNERNKRDYPPRRLLCDS